VLGGSFDPPHLGHLHAARRARRAFDLEHVVFVPAARPPHKPERILAEGEERLAMLALLLEGEPGCSPWDVELVRPGPSYSVDTLRELAALVPATRLFFILGEDNLHGLPRWRDVEELLRLAQPVVVHRRGGEAGAQPVDLSPLSAFARTRLEIGRLGGEPWDAASTELRARLARGEPCAELLPERLREHLAARALYRHP
jgi:nicotinate-nucleotide adenylyltransferase